MAQTVSSRTTLANILTGACFISFSGVWVVWSGVEPLVSAFYRVLFGGLFLLVPCSLKGEFPSLETGRLLLIALCGLCFAADLLCWHMAIVHIGPGLATILGNFQIFILTFIAIAFCGERLTWRFVAAVPLAVSGLFMIIGVAWDTLPENYQLGVWLGLATAVFYAGFLLILRRIQMGQKQPTFFFNLMSVSLTCAAVLGLSIIFTGSGFAIPSLPSLGALLGLGLLSQTIGWVFISRGLPQVAPFIAGLILLLQPALAFLWDVLIFDRPSTPLNWLGVGIALAAIYLGMTSGGKKRESEV